MAFLSAPIRLFAHTIHLTSSFYGQLHHLHPSVEFLKVYGNHMFLRVSFELQVIIQFTMNICFKQKKEIRLVSSREKLI
uniref:Secreted protein n=1 Tax=Caenorhabditis tropicalis TaxID=1561998 RepID=A0A1I7V0J9_9PELO